MGVGPFAEAQAVKSALEGEAKVEAGVMLTLLLWEQRVKDGSAALEDTCCKACQSINGSQLLLKRQRTGSLEDWACQGVNGTLLMQLQLNLNIKELEVGKLEVKLENGK